MAGFGLSAASVAAEEPAEDFLEALLQNGYHDVAVEYLSSLQNSTAVSEKFRKTIPFELARTIIKQSSRMRDLEKIEANLDRAQQLLTQYASSDTSLNVSARAFTL